MASDQFLLTVSNAPLCSPLKVNSRRENFAILIDRLEPIHKDAFGWALHCCNRQHSIAEDVLQLAYVKVVDGRAVFEAQSSLKTWWFGVIRFTAQEEMRRATVRQNLINKIIQRCIGWKLDTTPNFDESEADADCSAQLKCLQTALVKLPVRQAETIHLVYYHSLTVAEAANVMKISVGSACQHLSRAKLRLKQLMSDTEKV